MNFLRTFVDHFTDVAELDAKQKPFALSQTMLGDAKVYPREQHVVRDALRGDAKGPTKANHATEQSGFWGSGCDSSSRAGKILSSVFLLLALTGCTSAVVTHGIPNLAVVDHSIYRGGQPTLEGWTYLHDTLGVSNVVKLNLDTEGDDATAKDLDLGMRVTYAPITTEQQLLGPVGSQIRIAYTNITLGTYVHCEHGQDRTGLEIAYYRMHADGWLKAEAEQEMLDHGFHKELRGLWEFWEQAK
jgi:hypothetical protein